MTEDFDRGLAEGYRRAIEYRGVEDPCPKCHGHGVRAYGSTATWRGGIGGQTTTSDVCDGCWGSGDKNKTWTNLRTIAAEVERRVAECALTAIADSVGARMGGAHSEVLDIISALEALSRKRKVARWTPEFARSLVDLLRRAIEGKQP